MGFLHFAVGQHGPQLYRLYAAPEHYETGIGKALLEVLEARVDGVVERYILYVNDEIVLERRLADAQEARNSSTSRS